MKKVETERRINNLVDQELVQAIAIRLVKSNQHLSQLKLREEDDRASISKSVRDFVYYLLQETQQNDEDFNKMIRSIETEFRLPRLLEILSTSPMRRLKPILVHSFNIRAKNRAPSNVFQEYEKKQEFLGISSISQEDLYKFALICHQTVQPLFDVIQTSPIAPFGINAVLSKISQNNSLSTIRGTEVVSDLTTQLALECALRRKQNRISQNNKIVNLATFGRVIRLQPFDKTKGYMQHFNLFALCSGGINLANNGGFSIPNIKVHIETLLNVIFSLNKAGYKFYDISVKISDIRFLDQLIDSLSLPREVILRNTLNDEFDLFKEYNISFPPEVEKIEELAPSLFKEVGLIDHSEYFRRIDGSILKPLREAYPSVRFCFDFKRKSGLGYYLHQCFHIFAKNLEGATVQLADGGAVNWSEKFLESRNEAMVVSGIGAELIQKLFKCT